VVVQPVERSEKGQTLNVIPVEMGQKYSGVDGGAFGFLQQRLAERANAAAGVENDAFILRRPNLDARRIAAEFEVLDLGGWGGTADSPEFESYLYAVHLKGHFGTNPLAIAFFDLQFQSGCPCIAGSVGMIQCFFSVADLFLDRRVLVILLR